MIAAYHQLTTFNGHAPYRPSSFKRDGKLKQQVFILQGLPGVGPARAKLLLDKLLFVYGFTNGEWLPYEKNINYEAFLTTRK